MKRRLFQLAVFLLLGAVLNVAVAWGCALSIQLSRAGPPSKSVRAIGRELEPDGGWRFWSIVRVERPGVVLYYSYLHTRNERVEGVEVERSTDLRPFELAPSWADLRMPPATDYGIRWVHAFGWPFVSMWRDYGAFGDGYRYKLFHGLEVAFLPPDGGFPRAIPLDPIWLGFAFNTLFYAALLWLLIPGPFALRRLIRRTRGLCVACGYDLRHAEHDACPECGAAIPSPLRERARVKCSARSGHAGL